MRHVAAIDIEPDHAFPPRIGDRFVRRPIPIIAVYRAGGGIITGTSIIAGRIADEADAVT